MATTTGLTLKDLLGLVYLTRSLQAVKTGIPNNLPAEFYSDAVTERVLGDSARYTVLRGQRRVARRLNYGDPSRQRELRAIGTRDVKLWHAHEFVNFALHEYQAIRAFDSYEFTPVAAQAIDWQTKEFRALFDNAEVAMTTQMLGTGKNHWDRDGNMRDQTISGGWDIDAEIPAANRDQLNGIIGASWATTSTDIQGDVRAIRKQAARNTGYPIDCAFYGENIATYISANDTLKEYLARNPHFNDAFKQSGELPDGLLGIDKWVPVYESFFEDFAGTDQGFFGADTIVFTPAVDSTWWRRFEGSYMVPTSFQPLAYGAGGTAAAEQVYGKFGYAKLIDDPVSLQQHYGDTRLGLVVNPTAIFIADVTP